MLGYKELFGMRLKKCKFNLVEKQGTKYFLLSFINLNSAQMEYNTVRVLHLRNMHVPKIVQMADNDIVLDYIEGVTLYEDLATGATFKFGMIATAFVKMMREFQTYFPGKRVGDVDLRAYIVKGSLLYSFDFDCIISGTVAEAIADAILAVMGDKGISRDRQVAFCKLLVKASGESTDTLKEALQRLLPLCTGVSLTPDQLFAAIL